MRNRNAPVGHPECDDGVGDDDDDDSNNDDDDGNNNDDDGGDADNGDSVASFVTSLELE